MDTRLKRSEREEAASEFFHRICKIYGISVYSHKTEMWSGDDPESPVEGENVFQVTISFKDVDMEQMLLKEIVVKET